MDALNEFELITTDRVFELRTQTEQQTKQWLRAITLIKKEIKRKTRKKVKSLQKKKEENN